MEKIDTGFSFWLFFILKLDEPFRDSDLRKHLNFFFSTVLGIERKIFLFDILPADELRSVKVKCCGFNCSQALPYNP